MPSTTMMTKKSNIEIQKRIDRLEEERRDALRRASKSDAGLEYAERQREIAERRRLQLNEWYWLTGFPMVGREKV